MTQYQMIFDIDEHNILKTYINDFYRDYPIVYDEVRCVNIKMIDSSCYMYK
jgi:hypothetical protein